MISFRGLSRAGNQSQHVNSWRSISGPLLEFRLLRFSEPRWPGRPSVFWICADFKQDSVILAFDDYATAEQRSRCISLQAPSLRKQTPWYTWGSGSVCQLGVSSIWAQGVSVKVYLVHCASHSDTTSTSISRPRAPLIDWDLMQKQHELNTSTPQSI